MCGTNGRYLDRNEKESFKVCSLAVTTSTMYMNVGDQTRMDGHFTLKWWHHNVLKMYYEI